MYMQYTS